MIPTSCRLFGQDHAPKQSDREHERFNLKRSCSLRPAGVARFAQSVAGQLVGPFVEVMARMAPDPVPAHLMVRDRRIEPLPEVDVLDRLVVGGAPAVAFPL